MPHTIPNDKVRVKRTAKADKCQWCETKVELKDQFTVHNDLDADGGKGRVIKKKVGSRADAVLEANTSHWCSDCAEKRVKMSQRWLDRRAGVEANPRKSAAAKPAKKTAGRKRGAARAAKKSAARRSGHKASGASRASSSKAPAADVSGKTPEAGTEPF